MFLENLMMLIMYVKFIEDLLKLKKSSEIVNICSNKTIKLMDVIKIMNNITGYEIEVKVNQSFVRKDEIKSLSGSTEKLFNIIGVLNQKPFEETLREMFEA